MSLGTLRWQFAGVTNMTVVAKATVGLAPDAVAPLVEPEALHDNEVYELPGPTVMAPAEMVPYLPHPEVTAVGMAYLPKGQAEARVRLQLWRPNRLLIDKQLQVRVDPGTDLSVPNRVPLAYTHALGGLGSADNPIGRGTGGASQEVPNIIYPDHPDRIAGFAPVPKMFAARKSLVGAQWLKRPSVDPLVIPDPFDWTYFQAAPLDQRVEALAGNETLRLHGMTPSPKPLASRLPGLAASCRVYHREDARVPYDMLLRLESIHVDVERRRTHLLWRGSIPLPRPETLDPLVVVAALAPPGEPVAWPPKAPEVNDENEAEWIDDAFVLDGTGTISITPGRPGPPRGSMTVSLTSGTEVSKTLPFVDTDAPRPAGPANSGDIPGAPWARSSEEVVVEPDDALRSTLDSDAPWITPSSPQASPTPSSTVMDLPPEPSVAPVPVATAPDQDQQREAQGAEAARAEARRREEAERFEKEQAAAEAEAERRRRDAADQKLRAAKALEMQLYGGFKKK